VKGYRIAAIQEDGLPPDVKERYMSEHHFRVMLGLGDEGAGS